jgi:signal transduction histidine kinase
LFPLGDAVTKTVEMVSPLAEEKGLRLTLSLPPAADVIWSDRRCVEQVLLNLLSNALKFTERGSIVVERRLQPPWWVVEVSDTGIGIAAADLERIFAPFQQVDAPGGRVTEGTGLGLAISKRLLRALGGEMHVRSRLGEGTTFEVRLPTTTAGGDAAKPPGVNEPT